jgi:hypothetical protein
MDGAFFGLAFLAAVNPKLLGIDLLLMENRRPRMMFICFLLGAMGLSVTLGLVDVLAVRANAVQSQGSISAGLDLVLGVALLAVGGLVATGRLHARRKAPVPAGQPVPEKKEGWAQRTLREPRPLMAIVIGALAGTPGASYITGLHHLVSGKYSTATDVVAVIVFNLIMFSVVIIPLVFLVFRPEATKRSLRHFSDWLTSHARQLIAWVALGVGAYMAISGVVRLLS